MPPIGQVANTFIEIPLYEIQTRSPNSLYYRSGRPFPGLTKISVATFSAVDGNVALLEQYAQRWLECANVSVINLMLIAYVRLDY